MPLPIAASVETTMTIAPSPRVVVGDHAAVFTTHNNRPNLAMRDLGIADATGGQIAIYIVRANRPFDPKEDIGMHHHTAEFQYFFVLKGWQKMTFDDVGEVTIAAGNGWM